MGSNENVLNEKTALLKEARLKLLRLHKNLVDIERENYEQKNGSVSSGQFLNLLLNEPDLQWLRKFSTLIVEIDEMLDLDDGFSIEMIEKHLSAMKQLTEPKTSDESFNEKYLSVLNSRQEVERSNEEIKNLLSNANGKS